MSFNQIVIGSNTFNGSGTGRYMSNSVVFGGPLNYFKLSPGSRNSKTGVTSAAITRYLEYDVQDPTKPAGTMKRVTGVVTLSIQLDDYFSVQTADDLCGELSTFVTVDNLNRILNGES